MVSVIENNHSDPFDSLVRCVKYFFCSSIFAKYFIVGSGRVFAASILLAVFPFFNGCCLFCCSFWLFVVVIIRYAHFGILLAVFLLFGVR